MPALAVSRLGSVVARVQLFVIATAAMIWTLAVFPKFWSEAPIIEAATHIINGEVYKPQAMETLVAVLDSDRNVTLRPSDLSKAAIIRLRLAEDAIPGSNKQIADRRIDLAIESVNEALANTPSESFQWLALFRLENALSGFKTQNLRYLQMSYALDPRAAWIAVKRAPLALAFYPELPAPLADAVIIEFLGLVRSQLYNEAAIIIKGTTGPIRTVLLASLDELKEAERHPLDKLLYESNVTDAPPASTEKRLWQH